MSTKLNGSSNLSKLCLLYQEALRELESLMKNSQTPKSPKDVEKFGVEVSSLARKISDLIEAKQLQEAILSDEINKRAQKLAKGAPHKVKNFGEREVNIRFPGGSVLTVYVPYYARAGKHSKHGHGFYPSLLLLGLFDRCSPSLIADVAMLSAAMSSFDEVKFMLEQRGVVLGKNTIRTVTKRYAENARLGRQGNKDDLSLSKAKRGRRIVVSTDGGRLRTRKNKKGPKTKKGYTRYLTAWREPKLLIIYAIDKNGRQDQTEVPLVDGTLDGPNKLFELFAYYLSCFSLNKDDIITFVADGAKWIWDRAYILLSAFNLRRDKIYYVLDFYHAVEHIAALLKLKRWPPNDFNIWLKKCRKLLKTGETTKLIDFVKSITKGTKSQDIRRERNYFLNNEKRMQYGKLTDLNLPIGSGAMESAVRRIINLRLKGPGIFWHEDTATDIIFLRSFYKTGRWSDLKNMAYNGALQQIT